MLHQSFPIFGFHDIQNMKIIRTEYIYYFSYIAKREDIKIINDFGFKSLRSPSTRFLVLRKNPPVANFMLRREILAVACRCP